jgi:hypothetical protein
VSPSITTTITPKRAPTAIVSSNNSCTTSGRASVAIS